MVITPQELFEERLPRGLTTRPEILQSLKLTIQINVNGPKGGHWTVDTCADPPSCLPGIRDDVQCAIDISDEALMELISTESAARPQIFMKHILEGGIEIEGDATQAMKLSQIFAVGAVPQP